MRILTVIKQVPDSNAVIKVQQDGSGIETAGVKLVCDPFDEFGVELAIQLREKRGDVEDIALICLSGDKAGDAMRTALAMGVDRAIHIKDPKFESMNELFAARVLAEAIKKDEKDYDLILCGKYNIDLDAGAVGPALADFLDLPHVGAVIGLEFADDGKTFTARRRVEGAEEVVTCALPALLTIDKGLVDPRYPSLPNLMKAKKKPMQVLTSADLPGVNGSGAGVELLSIAPPPPRAECKLVEGEPQEMAQKLVRLLREEAKVV